MRTVTADGNGRIMLGTRFINKYGKKFEIVTNLKHIILVPISKNHPTELQKIKLEGAINKDTEFGLHEK
ncbi:hypothetical protein HYU10_04195 [Candidatus Woesearchaeota archaeon]|nr:hypothetical protein [Candidatus Woesearchaeota archaeon]MBI2130942.1 hypothetical protein [Candidatus Woesearchaeota archaeon]MBI2660822.1 hypothetical protein [Candidatus Woesearchaeota archaeon]